MKISSILNEVENPATLISSPCVACVNWDFKRADLRRCRAFPDGIPDEIFDGSSDHTKPFDGDGGVRFESVLRRNTQKRP